MAISIFNRLPALGSPKPLPRQDWRSVTFEALEPRWMLAGDGLDPAGEVATQESYNEEVEITALRLRINGELVTIDAADFTSNNPRLMLNTGDTLEVDAVFYNAADSAAGQEGKIQVEGYIWKLDEGSLTGPSLDYSDGRYSTSVLSADISDGAAQNGLNGGWTVEEGWNRLTLAVVRYYSGGYSVVDRAHLHLQVDVPDFTALGTSVTNTDGGWLRVGQEASVEGLLVNDGDGRYWTHAEVDIYHLSDRTDIVWVGTLRGTVDDHESLGGEFLNRPSTDAYSDRWTPDRSGFYLLKFYGDPEKRWAESDETNNMTYRIVLVLPDDQVDLPPALENQIDKVLRQLGGDTVEKPGKGGGKDSSSNPWNGLDALQENPQVLQSLFSVLHSGKPSKSELDAGMEWFASLSREEFKDLLEELRSL